MEWSFAIVLCVLITGFSYVGGKILDVIKPPLTQKDITKIANEVLEQLRKET